MKKGDIIEFTGKHSILKTNEYYKVYSVSENDLQVYMKTGFAGIPISDCILVKIGE